VTFLTYWHCKMSGSHKAGQTYPGGFEDGTTMSCMGVREGRGTDVTAATPVGRCALEVCDIAVWCVSFLPFYWHNSDALPLHPSPAPYTQGRGEPSHCCSW